MAEKRRPMKTFMHGVSRAAMVWGPADRSDPGAPVVHKHDEAEDSVEDQLAEFEIERDPDGHVYAFRREQKTPKEAPKETGQ